MSLITEALRRTRDASLQAPPPPLPAAPTRPALPPSIDQTPQDRTLRIILLVLLAVALLGGALAGYMAFRPAPMTAKVAAAASTAGPATPLGATADKPSAPPVVVEEPPPPAAVVEQPNPEPPPPPAPAPPKPPRELPKLTLQGITRDKTGYEALLNNWNVRVGEEIEGARVTAIENGIVKLDFDGREIVLRLR